MFNASAKLFYEYQKSKMEKAEEVNHQTLLADFHGFDGKKFIYEGDTVTVLFQGGSIALRMSQIDSHLVLFDERVEVVESTSAVKAK